MAKYKTPGVYIEERNAFPNSVVQVETAIPAFVGYTERAIYKGESLSGRAIKITSLAEFLLFFGGMPPVTFSVAADKAIPPAGSSTLLSSDSFSVTTDQKSLFYLYNCVRFFYQNGGAACYIVSVGDYSSRPDAVALLAGLEILKEEQEPTLILIPDALLLKPRDYYDKVARAMLNHCGKMEDRIAMLDVYDGATTDVQDLGKPDNVISKFRNGIGSEYLSYGVAYYPWLNTTVVQKGEVTFTNFGDMPACFEGDVKEQAEKVLASYHHPDQEEPLENIKIKAHNALMALSENYSTIISAATALLNTMPPCPAMAGIYTQIDNGRGVWKAPANVNVNSVVSLTVNISDNEQQSLNIDPVTGKSVNAIRSFPGSGVLVWGARTLDGNSGDWRYISVKRTVMMIEQSIKLATQSFVFEPNDANTWVGVKSMIENFLTNLWKQGALAGSKPEDAYFVNVGLGSTMTANDILDGNMIVRVGVAVSRPAEFIVVSFRQQQEKP